MAVKKEFWKIFLNPVSTIAIIRKIFFINFRRKIFGLGGMNEEEKKEIERKLPSHWMVRHRAYGIGVAEVKSWLVDYFLKLSK